MNSQTGPGLDVQAADLRAAGAIWWRERRSCDRCRGARLISGAEEKPLRQIAQDVFPPSRKGESAIGCARGGDVIAWRKRAQKVPAAQKCRDRFDALSLKRSNGQPAQ